MVPVSGGEGREVGSSLKTAWVEPPSCKSLWKGRLVHEDRASGCARKGLDRILGEFLHRKALQALAQRHWGRPHLCSDLDVALGDVDQCWEWAR